MEEEGTYQGLDGGDRLFFKDGIKRQGSPCELIILHGLGVMRGGVEVEKAAEGKDHEENS